jgi:hypothetical protein
MAQHLSDRCLALPGVSKTRAKKTPWHSFGGRGTLRGRLPHLMTWWRGVLAKGHRPRL